MDTQPSNSEHRINPMHRQAFSLIEIAIALASSTILVAGLTASLYISSQALTVDANSSQQTRLAAILLHDLTTDLNQAIAFTERTTTAFTFTVPDRNGDNVPETIRYAWGGYPGDPLTYQYNGGTPVEIATDVQTFSATALLRTMLAETVSLPTASAVVFEEFTEAKLGAPGGTSITIALPPGTVEGDLLIAAVVTYGDSSASLAGNSGWNPIKLGASGGFMGETLGVWWKTASSSESSSYQFSWPTSPPNKQAYGWVMRFTGQDSTTPINNFTFQTGTSSPTTIPSPSVVTTVDNAMILRLGGFKSSSVTVGSPGLTGHTAITMNKSTSSAFDGYAASGGAGYMNQATAGDSGSSLFTLAGGATTPYTTVTIAIAPETDP